MDVQPQEAPVLDLVCAPNADLLGLIRSVVVAVSREIGFPPDEADQIELSVDEACTNVIRHAYGAPDRSIAASERTMRIQICPASDHLAIRVIDRGTGPPPEGPRGVSSAEEYASQARPKGLGSFIITRFMDEVTYDSPPGSGTILSMVKYLPRPQR